MSDWEMVFSGAGYAANVIAAVLESHGLAVQVFEDSAYGSLMESRVFVPLADADRARELIEAAPLGLKWDPEGD